MSADADACKLIEYGSLVVCVARTNQPRRVFTIIKQNSKQLRLHLSIMKRTPVRVKFTAFV